MSLPRSLAGAALVAGLAFPWTFAAAPVRPAVPAVAGSAATVAAPAAGTEKETVAAARAALAAKDPQKAVDLLAAYLRSAVGGAELEDVYGQALLALGRKDEAAFHFTRALRLCGDADAARKPILANLAKADPLATRAGALMKNASKQLFDVIQRLAEAGHSDRALALLDQIEPIATNPEKPAITALAAKLRAANQKVDLDEASGEGEASGDGPTNGDDSGDDSGGKGPPVVEFEGAHYKFSARMEKETVQRVSDVMDDIFNYYVQIYFDGDVSRVAPHKPTIEIHATHQDMLKDWQGPPTVGGWWSPGEWKVVCYDTRSDGAGKLEQMLMTLYHEASHHFMTMLAKGGGVPAWINEGTATFFEGATAMQDRRVLWPDAAIGRLTALNAQLSGSWPGPTASQVISFNQPGSYPGEYYSYGWGLVYYLQQYEDPVTLEYVFRPLYSQYREKIAKTGGDPMALFKEIFLQPTAPGGFTEFEPWAAKWSAWIKDKVYPLHFGARMRDLRMGKAREYVLAADRARDAKQAVPVSESELLLRALGHLEFVRTNIDRSDHIDPDLVVMQADVLERLGRPQGTAAILEQVLELADAGEAELEPARYEELEKRLTKLDAKNQPLRLAKTRARNFAKTALKLLDEYKASPTPMTLSAHEFAHVMAHALDSKELAAAAEELRVAAREAGLLAGALYAVGAKGPWVSLFERPDEKFDASEAAISIGGTKANARIFTGVPLAPEYEIRCTLGRVDEISRTTTQGVIFSGIANAPWYAVGIDGKGQVVVRRYEKTGSERTLEILPVDPPVAKDESPSFVVRVFDGGRITVRVGERAAVEYQLEDTLPKTAHVGVFAKNGRVEVRSMVVEVFP